VELYAWEEGLSECRSFFSFFRSLMTDRCLGRAWRREFGEGSEWGRSGMFRIVRMEQFAECLVDGGL
jgi:hypothetical protein